jgi:hypothetical protein
MLGYLRNVQLSLLVISLTCPVSMAYANSDADNDEKCMFYNTKLCPSVPVKKHKRHRKHRTQKNHRHIEKSSVANKMENEIEFNIPNRRSCKESVIWGYCEPFPPLKVNCEIINPSDLVDFTCDAFSDKVQSCEVYSCQAPYVLDPSVKTTWKIHGKSGDRCIISNTTENIGIKDDNEKPMPLTQICEYDQTGIEGLIQRFSDLENRYFHFSTCEHFEGIYNCTFKSGGVPIK